MEARILVTLEELRAMPRAELESALEALAPEERVQLADDLGVSRGRGMIKRIADALLSDSAPDDAAASGVRAAGGEDARVRAELLTWEIVQRDPGFLDTASASDLADYLSYLKTTQFESAADRKTFEEWKA